MCVAQLTAMDMEQITTASMSQNRQSQAGKSVLHLFSSERLAVFTIPYKPKPWNLVVFVIRDVQVIFPSAISCCWESSLKDKHRSQAMEHLKQLAIVFTQCNWVALTNESHECSKKTPNTIAYCA